MNCESKILQKKYIFESNIVNNMKLMILAKIRVIHTCSSSPRAMSVPEGTVGYPAQPGLIHLSVRLSVSTYLQIRY
jgi:hypothetical protein